MARGLKHLIECHCVLPQYRDRPDPIYHRFVVFTELDDDDNVVPKHAQCNNCGVVHRIIDIGRSEIMSGRETATTLVSVSDIKLSIPPNISDILELYNANLATWEEAAWIIQQQAWGSHIILASETREGHTEGKRLIFTGPGIAKIEPYSMSFMFPTQ
jgi:hypothetical protein